MSFAKKDPHAAKTAESLKLNLIYDHPQKSRTKRNIC